MITKYNVFILTIILFIFNMSWAKEKETPFTSKTKFELKPTSTLTLKPSSTENSVSYFFDMPGYGNCNVSAYQKNKKKFLIFSNSKYSTADTPDDNYSENHFNFSLINYTKGGMNLSIECNLQLKSSKILFVDFANDITKKDCLAKGGEVVIVSKESMLRGPNAHPLRLPYIQCTKREPKISKEQLADFFKKANLSISFKAEGDSKYIPDRVEDHSSSKTEATGR